MSGSEVSSVRNQGINFLVENHRPFLRSIIHHVFPNIFLVQVRVRRPSAFCLIPSAGCHCADSPPVPQRQLGREFGSPVQWWHPSRLFE